MNRDSMQPTLSHHQTHLRVNDAHLSLSVSKPKDTRAWVVYLATNPVGAARITDRLASVGLASIGVGPFQTSPRRSYLVDSLLAAYQWVGAQNQLPVALLGQSGQTAAMLQAAGELGNRLAALAIVVRNWQDVSWPARLRKVTAPTLLLYIQQDSGSRWASWWLRRWLGCSQRAQCHGPSDSAVAACWLGRALSGQVVHFDGPLRSKSGLVPSLSHSIGAAGLALFLGLPLSVHQSGNVAPAGNKSSSSHPQTQVVLQYIGPDQAAVPQALSAEAQVNSYITGNQARAAVAMDADGDFVVVWSSEGSSGSDTSSASVQAQLYDSSGVAQGGQFQVNTFTTGPQGDVAVAMDADGDFVVVWTSPGSLGTDNDISAILGQRYMSDGSPSGGEFQVNTWITDGQRYPSVAMDTDGDFVVVWQSYCQEGKPCSQSSNSIQGQRYNSDGSPNGSEFRVNTYTTDQQENPSVAMNASGEFVVVWQSVGSYTNDSDDRSVQVRRYNSSGVAQDVQEFQANTYTTDNQWFPKVAVDSNGDFVVVWESIGSPSGDNDLRSIQARRYSANGTAKDTTEFQVNTVTTGSQRRLGVAVDSNGDIVVVWQSDSSADTDNDLQSIQVRRYNADGTAKTSQELQANTYTTGIQRRPAVAMDTDGDFAVAWESYGSFGSDNSYSSVQVLRDFPAAVADLQASLSGSQVDLSWTHVGGNVDHYEVWRGPTPYFTPGSAGSVQLAANVTPVGGSASYPDTTANIGDASINDYYLVLSVSETGQASPVSNRAGAFDFDITPGSP